MTDFEIARDNMVFSQVRPNGVTDARISDAMRNVAREAFVGQGQADLAYMDEVVRTVDGRYLIEPIIFAKMLQALSPEDGDTVLDVAPGTGYSTAVLAALCETVIGLEDNADLVDQTSARLADLDITNAVIVEGNLTEGVAAQGPYDGIFVNQAVEFVPDALLDQLAEGGRLVALVLSGGNGAIRLYTKSAGLVSDKPVFDAVAPLMAGFEAPSGFTF